MHSTQVVHNVSIRSILALLTILTIAVSAPLPVYAQIGAFEDDVAAAEERNRARENSEEDDTEYVASSGDDDSAAWYIFFQIARALLWVNMQVSYGDLPYEEGSDFYRYPTESETSIDEYGNTTTTWKNSEGKLGFYRLRTDAAFIDQLGYRARVSLDGKILPLFGPKIDISGYANNPMALQDASFLMMRLGANFAIFQTNPVSMDWHIQYQRWFSETYDLNREGLVLGLELRGLPGSRLSWELRWDAQLFEYLTIHEFEGLLGWFASPGVEILGGYNIWAGDITQRAGPTFGLRFWL